MLVILTHWGRVAHICVGNLTIIGPDNGLSPGRGQAIIWTNARILLIGAWGSNFSELLIGIHTFSFEKMRLKMSSVKRLPFCLGLNVLNHRMVHKMNRIPPTLTKIRHVALVTHMFLLHRSKVSKPYFLCVYKQITYTLMQLYIYI